MPRPPIKLAKIVQNGATNTKLRVRLELHVARAVILFHRIKQAEDAGVNQVFQVNVLRQSLMNLASNESYLRNLLEQRGLVQARSRIRTMVLNGLHKFPRSDDGDNASSWPNIAGVPR